MTARACDACGAPARWTADLGAGGETLACDACRAAAVDAAGRAPGAPEAPGIDPIPPYAWHALGSAPACDLCAEVGDPPSPAAWRRDDPGIREVCEACRALCDAADDEERAARSAWSPLGAT